MHNPLLWLGLSLFLVAVCLVAVLLVAIPVMQELSRTARSAEKLLDMLSRELPPTLQSLRATGDDLSELSEQVNEGVRSASQVVTQVDQGLANVKTQAESVKRGGLSLFAGLKAAWQELQHPADGIAGEYDATLSSEAYGETQLARPHTARLPTASQGNVMGQPEMGQPDLSRPGQRLEGQAAQAAALGHSTPDGHSPSSLPLKLNSSDALETAVRQTAEESSTSSPQSP